MTIWLISDTHFGHANIIKYANRPFASVSEMDEQMTLRWQTLVAENDTVFHLGDFSLHKKDILRQFDLLPGRKFLIKGNHDHSKIVNLPWRGVFPYLELSKGEKFGQDIIPRDCVLFHYPISSWNGKFHGSCHFFGHVHAAVGFTEKRSLNICVEQTDYAPILLDKAIELAENEADARSDTQEALHV